MADVTDEVPIGHLLQSGSETHAHANRDGRRKPLRLPLHQEIIAIGTGKTMHSMWRCVIAAIAVLGGIATTARAQDYPTHPVRLISDSAPGSAIDVTMRIIADGLSRVWGQQAVLINQPGAGGAIAARAAATATPDGYTLGMMALSAFVALPGAADNLPIRSAARLRRRRPSWRRADVHHRGAMARREDAAGLDRAGEKAAGRTRLRRQRPRPAHPPDRRTAASQAGIKLLMVPYSGGTAQVLNDMMGERIALTFNSYSGIAGAVEARQRASRSRSPRRSASRCFPIYRRWRKRCPAFEVRAAGRCWWRRSARRRRSFRRPTPI